jgi:hypothetical protein
MERHKGLGEKKRDTKGNNIQSERGLLNGENIAPLEDESRSVGDMLSVQIISTLPRDESNAQPFLNL